MQQMLTIAGDPHEKLVVGVITDAGEGGRSVRDQRLEIHSALEMLSGFVLHLVPLYLQSSQHFTSYTSIVIIVIIILIIAIIINLLLTLTVAYIYLCDVHKTLQV